MKLQVIRPYDLKLQVIRPSDLKHQITRPSDLKIQVIGPNDFSKYPVTEFPKVGSKYQTTFNPNFQGAVQKWSI